MVQVDIYRKKSERQDIIVLDTGRYLSCNMFDFVVGYLRSHLSDEIVGIWFWDEDVTVMPCLKYQGIAIELFDYIRDRRSAVAELTKVLEEALARLD